MTTINFFHIGDNGHHAAMRPGGTKPAARSAKPSNKQDLKHLAKAVTPAADSKKHGKGGGFSLAMSGSADKLDEEFERF